MGKNRTSTASSKIDLKALYDDVQKLKSFHADDFEKLRNEEQRLANLETVRESAYLEIQKLTELRKQREADELEKQRLADELEKQRLEKLATESSVAREQKTEPELDHKIYGKLEYSEELKECLEYSDSDQSYIDDMTEELKDVTETDPALEKKLLRLCGSIKIEEVLCEACEKIRDEYIDKCKKDGVELTTYNYHRNTCKGCQKARFNSWKTKRRVEKSKEKATNKNNITKAKMKSIDKKIDLKNKLLNINEEYKQISEDRAIDILERIGSNKSDGKVNLNVFINIAKK